QVCQYQQNRYLKFTLATLTFLTLLTNRHLFIQIFYMNHHIIAATLLVIAGLAYLIAVKTSQSTPFYLSATALSLFILTRVEGALYVLIFFVTVYSSGYLRPQVRRNGILLATGLMAP